MPYLWLGKCNIQDSDKCNKFFQVLYSCCEHWQPLVFGLVCKLIPPISNAHSIFAKLKLIIKVAADWLPLL